MTNILQQIAANKRLEIEQAKVERPLGQLRRHIEDNPRPGSHRFKTALVDTSEVRIIAEMKKGSPSRGILRDDFDPRALASEYAAGGAVALSVLTDHKYFYGSFENLAIAGEAAPDTPLLCKDFILDAYQLFSARFHGADAALLIVALLTPKEIVELLEVARNLDMDCLVEVHDEAETKVAVDCGAGIVGVNNRNLRDFSVDLAVSEELGTIIPESVVKVSESGLHGPADIRRLLEAGFGAFLIGEALVKSDTPAQLLKEMRQA